MASDIVNQVQMNFTKPQAVDIASQSSSVSQGEPQPAVIGSNKSSEHNAEASQAELQQALHDVNAHAQEAHINMTFSMDKDLGRAVIKVVNSDTHEVIRQIPSQEFIQIAKSLEKTHSLLMKIEA